MYKTIASKTCDTAEELPAQYIAGIKAVNTIAADSCVTEGTVEHCILFNGVKIGN